MGIQLDLQVVLLLLLHPVKVMLAAKEEVVLTMGMVAAVAAVALVNKVVKILAAMVVLLIHQP
jgi:hypothetical protein